MNYKKNVSTKNVKNTNHNGCFLEHIRQTAAILKSEKRDKTADTYLCAMRVFAKFVDKTMNAEHVPFAALNNALIKSFERHLAERGVSMNSISFYMRVLRANYNRAVEEGLCSQTTPFKGVYTGVARTVKRAVEERVIKKLRTANLPDYLELARDMFMFSFYTRGMAFVDIASLKKSNISKGILRYTRSKTGQTLSIRLEECMTDIIAKYQNEEREYLFPIFPKRHHTARHYSTALCRYNRHLREISDIARLPVQLTSYVARHTWASIAKSKGVPISVISEGLGHSDEKTTRIYLASLDQKIIDKANLIVITEKMTMSRVSLTGSSLWF